MKKFTHPAGRAVIASVLVLVVSVFVGCSSKESTEAQDTSQAQTTYGRTIQKTKEAVAALSNPKVGTDPVCGMAIDENAVIVMIDSKEYGLCSEKCAEDLKADPGKYLVVASTEGHEGHDH